MTDKCPYCGSDTVRVQAREIGINENREAIVCERYFETFDGEPLCTAYTLCHAKNNKVANEGEPIGRLCSKELHKVHKAANEKLKLLWRNKIINKVWPYVVAYVTEDGKKLYATLVGVSEKSGYLRIEFFNGEQMIVPDEKLDTVDARTKTLLWLAQELGLTYPLSVQDLSEDETILAINKINQILREYED